MKKKKVTTSQINWLEVSQRLHKFTDLVNLPPKEIASQYEIKEDHLNSLLSGNILNFKDVVSLSEQLSINPKWLLLGKGKFQKIGRELKIRKGAGIRRSEFRKSVEEGEIVDEVLEFVLAVDDFKRKNKKPFPSSTDIFQIIHLLGYRKVAKELNNINEISAYD